MILSGANTYTGKTTIHQGILNVRSGQAFGSGSASVTISVDGATSRYSALEFEGSDFTVSGKPLSTTGSGISGAGALRNISGNHTWVGDVTLTSGGGGSTYQSDAGTLTINGAIAANTTSRSLTLQGAGNGVITGAIQDGSTVGLPVTKNGAGTWTLGANTYTGNTTVNAGVLKATSISNAANTTLKAGAKLQVNYLAQNQLVVGAGATVVLGGVAAAASDAETGAAAADSGIVASIEISTAPIAATESAALTSVEIAAAAAGIATAEDADPAMEPDDPPAAAASDASVNVLAPDLSDGVARPEPPAKGVVLGPTTSLVSQGVPPAKRADASAVPQKVALPAAAARQAIHRVVFGTMGIAELASRDEWSLVRLTLYGLEQATQERPRMKKNLLFQCALDDVFAAD